MGVWEEIEFAKKISPIRKLLQHAAGETFRAAGEIEFVFPVTKERHVFFFSVKQSYTINLEYIGRARVPHALVSEICSVASYKEK